MFGKGQPKSAVHRTLHIEHWQKCKFKSIRLYRFVPKPEIYYSLFIYFFLLHYLCYPKNVNKRVDPESEYANVLLNLYGKKEKMNNKKRNKEHSMRMVNDLYKNRK